MAKDHGNQIKDDELYEKLREEGNSKENLSMTFVPPVMQMPNEPSPAKAISQFRVGEQKDWLNSYAQNKTLKPTFQTI